MRIGRPFSSRYKPGDTISTKLYGAFVVVKVESATKILCRSVTTGYELYKQAAHLDSGSIKDPLYPSILGVGFFGVGGYTSKTSTAAYQKWRNMLARCYDPDYQKENPSYAGCSVDHRWHSFQEFAKWFESQPQFQSRGIHLDKDIKYPGNKIYGPDTCLLVSARENIQASLCMKAVLISPDGEIHSTENVSEFCRQHGLSQAHISSVLRGSRNHHKGWKRCVKP